ncbi:hypothetical protein NE237_020139 [Protea cynaroides]|uniref:NB-ARC domain-containing protein n=1 Tax=Protea cynaroides TaxID=273540 RepID=A0A9Q0K1D2_9MAGN|nr:hypothetical protein NE237_020139 [Protea cynaroides]
MRVKNLIREVREVACLAEDVVGTFHLETEGRDTSRRVSFLTNFISIFEKLKTRHKVGKKIQQIRLKIQEISQSRSSYGIGNIATDREGKNYERQSSLKKWRRSYPYIEEPDFVGFKEDIEILEARLLQREERRPRETLLLFEEEEILNRVDDIWKTGTWDELQAALPDGMSGSKVIITTRNRYVAIYADAGTPAHELSFLEDDESWELFSRKAFPILNMAAPTRTKQDGFSESSVSSTASQRARHRVVPRKARYPVLLLRGLGIEYGFSDGIGKVSPSFARLRAQKRAPCHTPSAFQRTEGAS